MNKTTWQRVKLGEIAESIVSGGTPLTSKSEYYNGAIPWLNTKEVKNNRIYFTEKTITEFGLANSSAKWIEKDSVIVAMYGATAGKVAINKIPLTTNQACCNITLDANKADYNFIYYTLLNSFEKLEQMTSGAAQQNLNVGLISNFSFSLPPLETQQRIAEILSSLDDKIDLLHRQNKTLESLSLTLFRHTFIDNPNRNAWQISKLGDYVTPKKGKNITQKNASKGIYPVIAGGLEPAYYHNQSNTQSPVITISASGANAGFVNIHYCPVWSSDSSYIDSTITPYIYFSYLFLKHNQNILYDKQEGSAQPHIYPSHIMELEMPHYPKELMESFETQIQVYFNKISHNMKEIQSLESLRDIMLPKLLSGEMEV